MNTQNCTHRHTKKRGYRINYGKLMLLVGMLSFLVIFGTGIVKAADSNYEVRNRIYTSVSIKKGDTLWDIASEYADSDMSVKEYINELITINNLPSTDITAGQRLIVFYFE